MIIYYVLFCITIFLTYFFVYRMLFVQKYFVVNTYFSYYIIEYYARVCLREK